MLSLIKIFAFLFPLICLYIWWLFMVQQVMTKIKKNCVRIEQNNTFFAHLYVCVCCSFYMLRYIRYQPILRGWELMAESHRHTPKDIIFCHFELYYIVRINELILYTTHVCTHTWTKQYKAKQSKTKQKKHFKKSLTFLLIQHICATFQ